VGKADRRFADLVLDEIAVVMLPQPIIEIWQCGR
jgi:hypothetical protein